MERYISLIAVLLCLFPGWCIAQTINISGKDSISVVNAPMPVTPGEFKPDSRKATIFAAICPGLGQIYNRKYWKLPLVYGSFIGCAYAITWNGNQYNGYRKAYVDFIDEDPSTDSWEDYRYGSYRRTDFKDWTGEMKRSFANALKSGRDMHRRNRDLSYIVTVGVYAIWIIDAYVDAQLFDFDISPDLSMRVEPVLFDHTPNNTFSIGMQLSFAF